MTPSFSDNDVKNSIKNYAEPLLSIMGVQMNWNQVEQATKLSVNSNENNYLFKLEANPEQAKLVDKLYLYESANVKLKQQKQIPSEWNKKDLGDISISSNKKKK
ncbi:hypothetical protein SGLAD_v1c02050 [Spiroplasma gladiatoris]|uniref:Uncharacterized protein n=1 Tax=Spiroplasma gladiatoris TaxID=2143 RepID=A0A4P7AGB8_9MOLU|nr:hypothetical protein [Spiroplasma gladiatoris]QBQ07404.1 hypothetical protein SGLAD_v1c02050 [Spiroplasma gladiatoris]